MGLLVLIFALVLVRTAWVCDDAYITFRTSANLVHGEGPVYNPGERVQAFSNPLWMFLAAGAYGLSGEAYNASIVLSLVLSIAALLLLTFRISRNWWQAMLVIFVLILSKAYTDFSTSGLENPLSHVLITAFVFIFIQKEHSHRRLFFLSLFTGLLMFTRPDLGLLLLPALIYAWRRTEGKGKWKMVLMGMLPFLLWELFALWYYGFLFPNPWFAKLGRGVPLAEKIGEGQTYFLDTLLHDPVTMLVLLGGMLVAFVGKKNGRAALGIGVLLYVAAVIWSGGDFMRGRFFAAPFLMGVLVMANMEIKRTYALTIGGILVLGGCLMPDCPLWSGPNYHIGRTEDPKAMYPNGITDERAMAWRMSGWIADVEEKTIHKVEADARAAWKAHREGRGEPRLEKGVAIGFLGYRRGPDVHVLDQLALSDPLLARLPAMELSWKRPGHFPRMIPWGYDNHLQGEPGGLHDRELHAYNAALQEITRGDLWSMRRLKTIFRFNFGAYREHVDKDRYRSGTIPIDASYLSRRILREGEKSDGPGILHVPKWQPALVEWEAPVHLQRIELGISGGMSYRIQFRSKGMPYGSFLVNVDCKASPDICVLALDVPKTMAKIGFDALWIRPEEGDRAWGLSGLHAY